MSEDLKKKVIEEIRKTGYPTELRVGNLLSRLGWNVNYNRYYFDRDEQKGREIDISAFLLSSSKGLSIGLHLIFQVKSSKKPWVVFSSKREIFEGGGWHRLNYGNEVAITDLSEDELEKESSLVKISRIGRSYCECFKSENEKKEIFEALTSVVKASEHCLEKNKEAAKRTEKHRRYLHFVEPVIVLDGLLYEAYISTKDELKVNEIAYIPVSFGFISGAYGRFGILGYLVDLLTLKELPNFLLVKKNWLDSIHTTLNKKTKSDK